MSETTSHTITGGADRIAQTLSEWRRQLLDTSKISKLINCKFSRGSGGTSAGGALLLEHPAAERLWDAMAVREMPVSFAWTSTLLPGTPSETSLATIPSAPEINTDEPVASKSTRANLNSEELQACLASERLKPDEILTGLFDKRMDATLKRMSLTAQTSLSEQGINSLFLAFGFIRWFESADSEVEVISPLLLMPVTLSKEHGQSTWVLRPLDEEIAANHSLAELFRSDFRISLPVAEDEELRGGAETFGNYLESVRAVIAGQTRWTVDARSALGSFGFQKISMWQDLRRNEGRIIDHQLCRSIAGDADAMTHSESSCAPDDPQTVDDLAATDDPDASAAAHNLILDCDGSQLAAVTAVKNGSNLILDGPPGTGKSQTIANIIAETLAAGKTVLFVSEKSAALEVVKRRLDAKNIGDFCLECHSHKSNKKAVIEELGRCLNHESERYPGQEERLGELNHCRQTLNRYVRALHAIRSELGISAYQMHARLASLRSPPVSRVEIVEPHRISKSRLQAIEESVARLVRCEAIIAQHGEHPWKGCRPELITLSFVDDARHHFQRAADALERRRSAASPLVELGLLRDPFAESQLQHARRMGKAAAQFPVVPETWVKAGLRNSAETYIRLEELASEFRIALTAAEAFNRASLATAPLDVFRNVDQIVRDLRPLLPGLPTTLREVLRYVRDARAQLLTAVATIDTLRATARELLKQLDLPEASAVSAIDIRNVADAGRTLGVTGKISDTWFDASRRAQLKRLHTEAQQAADFAQLARNALGSRLQPLVFTAASAGTVEELLTNSSFFGRWGVNWRRARQAFAALYAETPPKRGGLLDDAFLLKKYHAAVDTLKSVAQNADGYALGWDGSIDFDWRAAGARLAQFEAISPAILQSPGFVAVAEQLDAPAIARIRSGVADVDRNLFKFSSAFRSLSAVVKVPPWPIEQLEDGDLAQLRMLAENLDAKLTAAEAAVQTSLSFLSETADLRIEQLGQDVDVLTTLRSLHGEAIVVAKRIGAQIASIDVGSLGEYARHAALGQWLLRFLERFGGKPPASLVRLLSDRAARSKLVTGIKAIDEADTQELGTSLKFVHDAFTNDRPVSGGIVLSQANESERISWLKDRARDAKASLDWRDYLNTCSELERNGLAVLRDEVLSGTIPAGEALAAFRARFRKRWLDEAYRNEPLLRDFDPGVHDNVAERFRELDRFWIHNGFTRIRPRLLEQCPKPTRLGATAPNTSEIGVLLRETNKKRRHLPLRKLFAAMPTLLQRLKPCIMMSPLSVSTYFDSCDTRFDLVIFDEASQVRPHDAICAIYRGKQLVVAGDQKQLPPTNFFERLSTEEVDGEDEDGASTNDFESILDACAALGLPRQRLKWHYRSRRESLISFSNRNFYGGELITFPSVLDVDGSSGVTFNFVSDARRGKPGSVTNAAEATRIAEAVVRHATLRPEKSLGVITMNVGQQILVMDEIARLRQNDSKTGSFFSASNPERFFVKNLENVQGDERDFIFMGIGFAKNETGTLNHSFGPLNRSGGERRLNVAVTRARESLCVFSSIKAQDIDRSRTGSVGAALLQAYLDLPSVVR